MTQLMKDVFMASVFLIPATFLINTTMEILKRNNKHAENILASLTAFFLSIVFLAGYFEQISSTPQALFIAVYVVYPFSFLSAGTSVMLHYQITRNYHRISRTIIILFSYSPVIIYFTFLLISGKQSLISSVIEVGFWKYESLTPLMLLLMSILFLFFMFNVSISNRARRNSVAVAKKRYSFLIRSNLYYQAVTIVIVLITLYPSSPIPGNATLFASMIWGVSLRILMIKYDLFPSINRKFELLYQLSPVPILLMDKSSFIKEANPSAEQLLGAGPGSLEGNSFLEFIKQDERAAFLEQYMSELPIHAWSNKEFMITNKQNIKKSLIADMEILSVGDEWYVYAMLRDNTKQKEEELKIEYLAHHDTLTQLPNRLLFNLKLEEAFAQVKRSDGLLAVVLIDLDRFKMINDTLGHQYGDEALVVISRRLCSIMEPNYLVSRLGGDEFIILIPALKEYDEVVRLSEVILEVFKQSVNLQDHDFFLGGSIGISIYPSDGDDPSTLIRKADIAMYQAKSRGGNQYRLYSKEMDIIFLRNSEMEIYLRNALSRNELSLHYQPQYAFADGRLIGMEALIRWNSEELGIVPPSEFIPVAELTGIIVDIGKWVLEAACKQAMKWLERTNFVMSINISSRQFMQPDLVEIIEDALKTTGLNPQNLCLEVTESTVIKHLDVARKMLDDLVQLGVKVAIDDFGTGYSSLSILNQLPVSVIKIDRSFIQDMTKDAAIVKAIISMGHDLHKEVVAEGVESTEQYELLKILNCNIGQGYLMSKPLSTEDVDTLLDQSDLDYRNGACCTAIIRCS